jgi:hypothetical protein
LFNSVFIHYGSWISLLTHFISAQRLSERTVFVIELICLLGVRNLALKYNLDEVLYLKSLSPSSAQVKNEWRCTSIQTTYLRGVGRDELAFASLK